jgi:hypothetical protein
LKKKETEKEAGFLHGVWIYFLFLALTVGVMIGISNMVQLLFA